MKHDAGLWVYRLTTLFLIRGVGAVGDRVALWIRLLQAGSIGAHIGHICTLHTWTHTHTHTHTHTLMLLLSLHAADFRTENWLMFLWVLSSMRGWSSFKLIQSNAWPVGETPLNNQHCWWKSIWCDSQMLTDEVILKRVTHITITSCSSSLSDSLYSDGRPHEKHRYFE